ncbi:response regulator [Streptomyces sp. NPDC059651]|uniref:response regulator transcription factor n=1 Tax=Streptomyces sp. NPDC059651 TaxID=3346897 RepID=UPI0036C72C7B
MTIRVVVADDQELVRSGFAMILDAQPDIEVVAEVGDGAAAVDAVRRLAPDVALLDIRMPGTDGIEACRAIAAGTGCRTVMLTTFDSDEYVYEALHAGASGFLLKDVRRDDLVHAVRVVAAGESLLAPSVARRLVAAYTSRPADSAAPSATVATVASAATVATVASAATVATVASVASVAEPSARLDVLTTREHETLLHLARGLSNAEIAAALVVSEHTVKTHVGNVLSKLGLRDRIQAVICAYECGVVSPSAEGETEGFSPVQGRRSPSRKPPHG